MLSFILRQFLGELQLPALLSSFLQSWWKRDGMIAELQHLTAPWSVTASSSATWGHVCFQLPLPAILAELHLQITLLKCPCVCPYLSSAC